MRFEQAANLKNEGLGGEGRWWGGWSRGSLSLLSINVGLSAPELRTCSSTIIWFFAFATRQLSSTLPPLDLSLHLNAFG